MTNGEVRSPYGGTVIAVLVAFGMTVEQGEELVIIEASRMKVPITAPSPGMVVAVDVKPGAQVKSGDLLVVLAV